MKFSALILSIFTILSFSVNCNSQITIKLNGKSFARGNNTLYRGFMNYISLEGEDDKFIYSITGTNVSIIKAHTSNENSEFYVKPGRGQSATISITKTDNDGNRSVMSTTSFKVATLPEPVVHIDGAQSGSSCSEESKVVSVKYEAYVQLESIFVVKSFTLTCGDESLSSDTDKITSEMSELLKTVKTGDSVTFICNVKGPDGIVRKLSGMFTKK